MGNIEESDKGREVQKSPEKAAHAGSHEAMKHADEMVAAKHTEMAHQKNTENRPPTPTTKGFGRPEIVGDDGKPLVRGAKPSDSTGSDGKRTAAEADKVPPHKPGETLTADEIKKAASGSLDDAAAYVKSINDPNPEKQSQLRAQAAVDIINARCYTTNEWKTSKIAAPMGAWNPATLLGLNSESIADRNKDLDMYRELNEPIEYKGHKIQAVKIDIPKAAWDTGAARCGEHARLLQAMLNKAGEKDATVFETKDKVGEGGHAFVVMNMHKDAKQEPDPNKPKTWGPNAFVADSWNGRGIETDRDKVQKDILKDGERVVLGTKDSASSKAKMTPQGDGYRIPD